MILRIFSIFVFTVGPAALITPAPIPTPAPLPTPDWWDNSEEDLD